MNPDQEDPNNHVPDVSPDDQWDDLDSRQNAESPQIPLRPVDHGLPPKKELRRANVTLHGAHLKGDAASIEKVSSAFSGKKKGEDVGKIEKEKSRKKLVKSRVARRPKEVRSYGKKSVGSGGNTKKEDAEYVLDESARTDGNADVVEGQVPSSPDGKGSRLKVREITPEKDSGASVQCGSKLIPTASIQDEKSDEGDGVRRRRRFVRGERNDWGGRKGKSSTRWMSYSGLGIVLLVVLAVFLVQRTSRRSERESGRSLFSQLETAEKEEGIEPDESPDDFLTDSRDQAIRIYADFVTARSISDFSEYIYLGEENIPVIEGCWIPSDTSDDWYPEDQVIWEIHDADGVRYGLLEGVKENFTNFSAIFRNGESGLKLDWKATVRYCSASFEDLKSGKGDGSEIRVRISSSNFYTYALPEEKYQSYRLSSPDEQAVLWGYTESEGELGQTLRKLFELSQITGKVRDEVQVVISIDPGPEGSLPNQWIIKDMVRFSWLDK